MFVGSRRGHLVLVAFSGKRVYRDLAKRKRQLRWLPEIRTLNMVLFGPIRISFVASAELLSGVLRTFFARNGAVFVRP